MAQIHFGEPGSDGDRFWYENSLSSRRVDEVKQTTLADIIRRNTNIRSELPDTVFQIVAPQGGTQEPGGSRNNPGDGAGD